MGYWGGVNINIAVALVLQLYPTACPASLLRKFFLVFKSWRWPNPVMLTKPHDANLGLPVWNAYHVSNARQVAPIITPAYPAMNSTLSVSRQTLQILHEEFCRGHDIVDRLWKEHVKGGGGGDDVAGEAFAELFEPSDFFIAYPYYLSLCIVGPTQADAQAWAGFVESRLRRLVSDMLGKSLPLSKIQLWPKKIEACIADRSALLTQAQRRNSITYFVGFQVDILRMRGNQLNIEQQINNFRDWDLSRFQPHVHEMDLCTKDFRVKELPKLVFEGMYEGGKLEAMKKRRRIIDSDPKVQERKRKAKLAAMKARLDEIQKKKDAAIAKDAMEKKRKRDDEDEEAKAATQKKAKGEEGDSKAQENVDEAAGEPSEVADAAKVKVEDTVDEAALLESALDAIQADAGGEKKSREEAEADRRKLIAGEFLVEGGGGDDADDDVAGEQSWPDGAGDDGDELESGAEKDTSDDAPSAQDSSVPERKVLTELEREAEILRIAGYSVVSDDEAIIVGGNMIPSWRNPNVARSSRISTKVEEKSASGDDGEKKRVKRGLGNGGCVEIKFRTKFDVVELDENGFVIDKGDDDFQPSLAWTGRRGGFEFKLGERGLGYYRTGKKVIVPSNTAY